MVFFMLVKKAVNARELLLNYVSDLLLVPCKDAISLCLNYLLYCPLVIWNIPIFLYPQFCKGNKHAADITYCLYKILNAAWCQHGKFRAQHFRYASRCLVLRCINVVPLSRIWFDDSPSLRLYIFLFI